MKKSFISLLVMYLSIFVVACNTNKGLEFVPSSDDFDIVLAEQKVGEVVRYGFPEADTSSWEIERMIVEMGIFDFDQASVDFYMLGRSLYSDWNLSYGTRDRTIEHELFVMDSCLYDLWLDSSCIEEEQRVEIVSYFVEEILPELTK